MNCRWVAIILIALPASAADCKEAAAQLAPAHNALQRGDVARAESVFSSVQATYPQCPQAFFELGMVYDRTQQPGKAAVQFEKVINLDANNPQAYDYLALSLEPLGQFEKAEWAYKKGIEVNRPPMFDAFLDYNYGRFLMKQNRLQDAAKHLDRAVELTPTTRAVFYERAKLNEKLGKYQQARSDAEKALELKDPGAVILDLQVYYQLTRIYTRIGEKDLAAKYKQLAETSKVPVSSRMRGGR